MSDIFCKIIAGEVPSKFIAEDTDWIAINDIHPKAPLHALVIPRKHIESLNDLNDQGLAGTLLMAANKVATTLGIAKTGYRVMINTGEHGGQEVPHLHLHVMGGTNI